MTWLEIRPQDVWLFRDGKPFSAGEDHSANSMFPPTPLTVQGALRQKISVSLGVNLREYKEESTPQARQAVEYIGGHGDLEKLGAFYMRGPFISLRTDTGIVLLFPSPADLLKHKETNDFFITAPDTDTALSSDLDSSNYRLPRVMEDYENLPGSWMTADIFEKYLEGKLPDGAVFANKDEPNEDKKPLTPLSTYQSGKRIWHSDLIYQREARSGVSTDALKSFPEEGQLYHVQFVRPGDGIGLLVSVSDKIPENLLTGTMSLGGEQRQSSAVKLENVALPSRPNSISGRFKVVFLTPSYLDDGWQPKNGDWSGVFEHSVTLTSAMLYRPLKIGGWNSEKGTARSMHNYVSPGSVYYFETKESFKTPDALTQDPDSINAKALGFGQYAIGQW